jgi:hypothetical protein
MQDALGIPTNSFSKQWGLYKNRKMSNNTSVSPVKLFSQYYSSNIIKSIISSMPPMLLIGNIQTGS